MCGSCPSTGPRSACAVLLEALDASRLPGAPVLPEDRRERALGLSRSDLRERWAVLKILVTGSRDWTDARLIQQEIFRVLYETKTTYNSAALIHGACPTGADAIADQSGRDTGMHVVRVPADWSRWGRKAGYVRNAEMVELEPDICLAFIRNGSRGASITAQLAEAAGIETRRFLA